jgi:acyl carrier protein|tara:strand:+ start:1745 stop:1984 length:240 start_codon:yes stop_codon:yes gene_type:complete
VIDKKAIKVFKKVLKLKKIKILKNINQQKVKNWDSIANLNLIFALEEEFKIRFNDKDILNMKSLNEAINIIKKKKKLYA